MRASLALHTAARRYCLERHAYWSVRYAEIARRGADRERDGHGYTPEALDTFPRYHVLNAIRVELERIDPAGLGDFGAAKAGALRAGEMADDGFTRTPTGAIERRATAEERAAFCGYVAGLSAADLGGVEPLPYRRVLAAAEAGAVWARLREHWRMTEGFWYPLTGGPPGVVAFDAAAFDEGVPPSRLRGILSRRGVGRVWELREYGPQYEQDVSLFEPHYDGAEGYWSAGTLGWVVYASHEGSVTVGGWLLEELQPLWPAWQAHLWRGAS